MTDEAMAILRGLHPSLNCTRSLAVCLAACGLALLSCKHTPNAKEIQRSEIHYDLGIQAQHAGDIQGALREYQEALRLNPQFPEAHNAKGILLHLSFNRHDEAISHFKSAI